MAEVCPVCGGLGLQAFENPEGVRFMRDCVCRVQRRMERMLAGTRIPSRYEHCTLENFETSFTGATKSVAAAHIRARSATVMP
jgi:DNA replication protein DnaC